ncbi:MAG: thiamine ABC transporter ATP-binding protein [Gammaproteobacteria bacterium]|nr:MAG: thiamine ABC transporter ATP-binding protein [Gammaproteobacteria bacterium]
MIKLKNLCYHYRHGHDNLAMQFDLSVAKAEKIAVVGASGAGKSTLLHLIAGFIFADSGEICLAGKDHRYSQPYQRPVSILFQENNLFDHLNVIENLTLGLQPRLTVTPRQRQQTQQIAEQVGLQDYLYRLPTQLSGGQKQRVALARCLLRDKPILLLDEPFSALDKALRDDMLLLVEQIYQEKQLTLLMVSHQADELADFVHRHIVIEQGHIVVN